jgi:F-type H+-transporting ATPase subunit b
MLEVDITLLYQIIVYFILLFTLNKVLYKPVIALLDERKRRIEEPVKDAEAIDVTVADGLVKYEQNLREATAKAQEERSVVRQEGINRENEIMEQARQEAQLELKKLRSELKDSADSARATLKQETGEISRSIAGKVLGRALGMAAIFTALITAFIMMEPGLAMAATDATAAAAAWNNPWRLGNFAILAILMVLLWIKVLRPLLDKRANDIAAALKLAEATKADAEAKLAEYEQKVSDLDSRVAVIRERLKAEALDEKARIIADAEEQATRLSEQVRTTAAQELKKAKIAIREEIAELSVEAAREILAKEVKSEDEERITGEYLGKLRLQ